MIKKEIDNTLNELSNIRNFIGQYSKKYYLVVKKNNLKKSNSLEKDSFERLFTHSDKYALVYGIFYIPFCLKNEWIKDKFFEISDLEMESINQDLESIEKPDIWISIDQSKEKQKEQRKLIETQEKQIYSKHFDFIIKKKGLDFYKILENQGIDVEIVKNTLDIKGELEHRAKILEQTHKDLLAKKVEMNKDENYNSYMQSSWEKQENWDFEKELSEEDFKRIVQFKIDEGLAGESNKIYKAFEFYLDITNKNGSNSEREAWNVWDKLNNGDNGDKNTQILIYFLMDIKIEWLIKNKIKWQGAGDDNHGWHYHEAEWKNGSWVYMGSYFDPTDSWDDWDE